MPLVNPRCGEDSLGKNPQMTGIAPYAVDSGEGRWTVDAAIESKMLSPARWQNGVDPVPTGGVCISEAGLSLSVADEPARRRQPDPRETG